MGKSSTKKKKKKLSRDSSRRKKSKRNKSKKLLRRRDHSDTSELSGTVSSSGSYSSSEDDYRRRQKGRSRGKAEGGKGKRKRLRRRYSSSESDYDSDHLKRKRRSKRKAGNVGKKRTRPRKKRRRDVSVSSASAASGSTPPSQSDSGNSGESEDERKRVKLERRGKNKRIRDRPCSQDSEDDGYLHGRDEFVSEKSSKRLRSVIVATTSNGDEGEEEMVYDSEDYPSCRSNDSNEGDDKREFERYEASVEKNAEYREEGQTTNQAPAIGGGSECEDLEAILRVQALENLRRFRGESQRNAVTSKELSTATEEEPLTIEPAKVEELPGCHLLEQKISVPASKPDLESPWKVQNAVDVLKETGSVLHDRASPQDQLLVGASKEKVSAGVNSSSARPKLIRPILRQDNSNHSSATKQAAETQDTQPQSTSKDSIDKSGPESSQTTAAKNGSDNVKGRDFNDTPREQSSYAETQSGNGGLDKSQKEDKEGSQFEQKTMSVMRGGEMVQVSYKVYIPKKTPALARRTLKR